MLPLQNSVQRTIETIKRPSGLYKDPRYDIFKTWPNATILPVVKMSAVNVTVKHVKGVKDVH